MIDVVKMIGAFLMIEVAGLVEKKMEIRRDEDRGQ